MAILPALFRDTARSAIHLEMRDGYEPDDPDWLEWRDGQHFDPAERWPEWFGMMRDTTARGVAVRRARIVSEPVTEYVRYEYDVTSAFNIASGEDVRWLPRSRAVGLLIPAVDFWIFDESVVMVNHFDGDGGIVEQVRHDDTDLAARYAAAFEEIWQRATPHAEYAI